MSFEAAVIPTWGWHYNIKWTSIVDFGYTLPSFDKHSRNSYITIILRYDDTTIRWAATWPRISSTSNETCDFLGEAMLTQPSIYYWFILIYSDIREINGQEFILNLKLKTKIIWQLLKCKQLWKEFCFSSRPSSLASNVLGWVIRRLLASTVYSSASLPGNQIILWKWKLRQTFQVWVIRKSWGTINIENLYQAIVFFLASYYVRYTVWRSKLVT